MNGLADLPACQQQSTSDLEAECVEDGGFNAIHANRAVFPAVNIVALDALHARQQAAKCSLGLFELQHNPMLVCTAMAYHRS